MLNDTKPNNNKGRAGKINTGAPLTRYTTESFIEKAKAKHGDKYDYSKVKYVNCDTKVCIICPEHGEFWQTPYKHCIGNKCPHCAGIIHENGRRLSQNEFIKKALVVHGDKYDYSKVKYGNYNTKVCIICQEHGEFWVSPRNFLSGKGCPQCWHKKSSETLRKDTNYFINKSQSIYGDRFDYSKVKYVNNTAKVCIICPEHGEFWQAPADHYRSNGCKQCVIDYLKTKFRKTTDQFIYDCQAVHGNRYDYSKTTYTTNKDKVCIICPEHGEFWQSASSHLKGRGCPLCNESHMEKDMAKHLSEMYVRNKHFKWMGGKSLDFYLPDYNAAIECQGVQHFKQVPFFDKLDDFEQRINRDKKKKQLCEEHNVKLFYYSVLTEYNEFLGEKVYHEINELINDIRQCKI